MNLPESAALLCVGRPQEIGLCNHTKVFVQVQALGQEAPAQSDELVARMVLYLPAASDHQLAEDLRFGKRLTLLGEDLHAGWGDSGGPAGVPGDFRHGSERLSGRRWDTLLRRAVRYLYGEVGKLEGMLQRRQARLRVAGWEHYAAQHGLLPQSPPVVPERPTRNIIRNGGPSHESLR